MDIAYNPHDGICRGTGIQIKLQGVTNGAVMGPILRGQRFADHYLGRAIFLRAFSKGPAVDQWDSHNGEIVLTHRAGLSSGHISGTRNCKAVGKISSHFHPARQGRPPNQRSRFNSWQGLDLLAKTAEEPRLAGGGRISGYRQGKLIGNTMLHLKTRIDAHESLKA